MKEVNALKDLEIMINTFKKQPTQNHFLGVLRVLAYCDVFIPLYRTKPLVPYIISDQNHAHLIPIFTKVEYIPLDWQKGEMLKLPMNKAIEFVEMNSKQELSIVLNMNKDNIILEKKAIEMFKANIQ